jgi:hypothetical protein
MLAVIDFVHHTLPSFGRETNDVLSAMGALHHNPGTSSARRCRPDGQRIETARSDHVRRSIKNLPSSPQGDDHELPRA